MVNVQVGRLPTPHAFCQRTYDCAFGFAVRVMVWPGGTWTEQVCAQSMPGPVMVPPAPTAVSCPISMTRVKVLSGKVAPMVRSVVARRVQDGPAGAGQPAVHRPKTWPGPA